MGITAPYRAEAMETVRHSHRQRVSAALYLQGSGVPLELQNVAGTVTFSEDWSPHVQMKISATAPTDPDTVRRIDPRDYARVEVSAGYLYPGQEPDVQILAAAALQEREIESPGAALVFEANSAELRAQESKWLLPTQTKNFPGVLEALQWLQSYAMGAAAFSATIGPGYRPDLVGTVVLEQGADMWSIMDSIVLAAGLRIYVTPSGSWRVEPKTTLAGVTAVFLEEGATTFVATIKDVLSRNGWYTAAVLKYTWSDGTGSHTITGTHTPDPGGATPGSGQKVFTENRTGPISQYDADLAAKTTVANLSTRGDSYEVTAVACYWLRPGHTAQVTLANGTTVRHIVRSVSFNLGAGTMTVTTREPSNTTS